MLKLVVSIVLLSVGILVAAQNGPQQSTPQVREPALLQNYITFTVTAPPVALGLDPFYKKYVDAHGIPVVSSEKVPDQALLMARDIVQFMLSGTS